MTETTVVSQFIRVVSTVDTSDGRLTKGKIYEGFFLVVNSSTARGRKHNGLRFFCPDDKGNFMTFNPYVFKKADA